MIKYFPKNRITTNLYTKGDEFTVNGSPYIGSYYKTYNGKAFAGKNPIEGSSKELAPIILNSLENNPTGVYTGGGIAFNDFTRPYLINPNIKSTQTFSSPTLYYPQPTDQDYQRGFVMRYFAKKRNEIGYVIEINKSTYDSLLKEDTEFDYITYQVIDLFWQLTGPLKDTRENRQYKIAGIIDTNKRLVEEKDKNFRGLIEFIGGKYDKYARPTQS